MTTLSGWFGEKKTSFHIWLSLDRKVYRRFHNVIIPARNGTTQIDHILVSPYGVFIIETKNIKGWIFGSESEERWSQSLYGRNYPFQNPIRQTFRQKKILSQYLGLEESLIHTVIYFVGDCEFKTHLPANVINHGLGRFIGKYISRILSSEETQHIVGTLEQYMSRSPLTTRDHIRSLRERYNSTTVCPKCGSPLVARTAKKGPNAGSKFLGCENYPRCRYTRNA
jgi:restriction system protein